MKNTELIFSDWQILHYTEAYKKQKSYFDDNLKRKTAQQPTLNHVFFVEHPHVYTLGKHGNSNNLKINNLQLQEINAEFIKTDRGGDITYHGYGQLVVYPVLDLDNFGLHVKRYVNILEQTIIDLLEKEFGIYARRLENAPGVWLTDRKKPEKICAIGVKVSKEITMHGLALNVNTNLNYFNFINACGFTDKGVTSIQKETGTEIDMNLVKNLFKKHFLRLMSEQT